MPSASRRRWRAIDALARFWADDKGLSIFSALLLVVTFVLPPLVPPGIERSPVVEVFYALLLISGVQALAQRRLTRVVLMSVTVITLAVSLGSWVLPVPESWVRGTGLLSLLVFLAVVLGQTLRSGPITFYRIQGAVAAYVLLGVIWAYAYDFVEFLRPGAFSGPGSPADGPRAFFYFSFVTLTTVGYGDVLPVHAVARSLVSLEAVVGTLYPAILIARLVSVVVVPGRGTDPDA
jgi:cation transport ATPase